MSRIISDKLEAHDPVVSPSAAPDVPLAGNHHRDIWWTASRISTATSVLVHMFILCVLAVVLITAHPHGTTSRLNATYTVEEADGGGIDFGNSEIEIDMPDQSAELVRDMVTSVSIPVTVLPESSVALEYIPSAPAPGADIVGGAKRGSGNTEGTSGSGAGADESDANGRGRVSFFGKEVVANSVAFVIDASQSMSGMRFQRARAELVNALRKLQPEQRFFVVFYTNETYPLFFPDNTVELIEASPRNLERVFRWIEQSQVQGGTQPQLAMVMTLKLKPDVVFFLSDGDIPVETQGIVKFNNHGTAVHTITFGSDVGAAIMRRIAAKNGGEYRFIPDGF